MYSTHVCSYCRLAEALLVRKGAQVERLLVDDDPVLHQQMVQRTGRKTVPQIYIGDRHIGGYRELVALDHTGELDDLLAQP